MNLARGQFLTGNVDILDQNDKEQEYEQIHPHFIQNIINELTHSQQNFICPQNPIKIWSRWFKL